MFKFSLKALFILISLFSIGFGVWVNGYKTALRETYERGQNTLPPISNDLPGGIIEIEKEYIEEEKHE